MEQCLEGLNVLFDMLWKYLVKLEYTHNNLLISVLNFKQRPWILITSKVLCCSGSVRYYLNLKSSDPLGWIHDGELRVPISHLTDWNTGFDHTHILLTSEWKSIPFYTTIKFYPENDAEVRFYLPNTTQPFAGFSASLLSINPSAFSEILWEYFIQPALEEVEMCGLKENFK